MNVKPEHLEVFHVHTVRTPSAKTEPSHIHIPRPSRLVDRAAEAKRVATEVALDEAA